MKKCKTCEIDKPLIDFYPRKDPVRMKHQPCKECVLKERKRSYWEDPQKHSERAKRYRKERPHVMRDMKLKQAYGVGIEYFDAKLKEQGGTCAGCRQNVKTIWRGKEVAMALDHDHITRKPRGVLCMHCNRALGSLRDNKKTLKNLIDYIKKYQN